jgi:hypothetical protein
MLNSPGGSTTVNDLDNIRKYYTIFINTMSTIARSFGAKIVKNITDGLIMYFPKTSNSIDDSAFKVVIAVMGSVLHTSVDFSLLGFRYSFYSLHWIFI